MNSVDEQANRLTETLGKAFLSHRITLDDCRRIVAEVLKTTRQEALREAAKVCRSNTYMSKDALDGGAFGGPGSCEYGCGDVIANELDRLASEGG